jgi:hypothetical protein
MSDPGQVDPVHLERFRAAVRMNVDQDWDRNRAPFIPNGNATRQATRRGGGNWNKEELSASCRAELVFSSGKPRVVTMYSSANTCILGPLHTALYDRFRKKGWLLVGDPTEQHINSLNGTSVFHSFDYSQATDRIRREYTRVMVEVLIEKSSGLTDDEVFALDVLSELRVDGMEEPAVRGQPMGSVMSFPLLCLINKTIVDLALADLLEQGSIGFKEYSQHRCKVNGDDLLVKEVRSDTDIRSLIIKNAALAGLLVNDSKSLVSDQLAEVNSTLFERNPETGLMEKRKKQNVSALWMKPDVNDVLGFALEATCDVKQFTRVVRANAHILAKQPVKVHCSLPPSIERVCRTDKRIRRAMTSLPLALRPIKEGIVRMAPAPETYELPREVENECMRREIERVRAAALLRAREPRERFKTSSVPNAISISRALRRPKRSDTKLIPLCYVRRYNLEQRERIIAEDLPVDDGYELPPGDGSRIDVLSDFLRSRKRVSGASVPTSSLSEDFISFEDC